MRASIFPIVGVPHSSAACPCLLLVRFFCTQLQWTLGLVLCWARCLQNGISALRIGSSTSEGQFCAARCVLVVIWRRCSFASCLPQSQLLVAAPPRWSTCSLVSARPPLNGGFFSALAAPPPLRFASSTHLHSFFGGGGGGRHSQEQAIANHLICSHGHVLSIVGFHLKADFC